MLYYTYLNDRYKIYKKEELACEKEFWSKALGISAARSDNRHLRYRKQTRYHECGMG